MVFSSPVFVFVFLPALIIVYFCANDRLKNIVLLAFSLAFYAFGEPKAILLMLLSIAVNYLASILIEKYSNRKKMFLLFAILFDVFILFVFKYLNFSVALFNRVTGAGLHIREFALPIGISFYTFQIMSYTIDVYRGKCPAQKNILNLSLYVSLFPQLIAGPIVRYVDIEKQISDRKVNIEGLYCGFLRFAIGFSKKVLIADQLSSLVDKAFSGTFPSWQLNWIGIIAYALQIYYDFSGYSDMAIGLGKIFGFHFSENFDYPYISKSIREFWRRWHISLGSWFRDYLYIPLGGNRKGTKRTYFNLLIVFIVTGLWHGASLNFLVWGLYYGIFLIAERTRFGNIQGKWPAVLQHAYALLIILIGWVFFRAENLSSAFQYLTGMVTASGADWNNFCFVMDRRYVFCLIAGIIFACPVFSKIRKQKEKTGIIPAISTVVLFVIAICYMVGSGFSPFLYFRF